MWNVSFAASGMPVLPLFPLNLVLCPAERLPLHIFEPRYLEMVRRCREEGIPFVLVYQSDEGRAAVGCTARVHRLIEQHPDGRLDILALGERRCRIGAVSDERPYLTAEVDLLDEADEPVEGRLRERLITQHMRLLELAGRTVRPHIYDEAPLISFVLGANGGLEAPKKQQLLEMDSERERIAFLSEHFDAFIPLVERAEEVRRKIRSNGHFKDFPPEE